MKKSISLSRRNFLRCAAVSCSAPLILPSGLWAAQTSANDRTTLGLVGMGTQNRELLWNFLRRSDTHVVAVCEVDSNRRESAKKMVENYYAESLSSGGYRGCSAYNDFRDLLDNKEIDGVVIATPDHWHALIAVAAAKAGKDIYCEKPMSHTIAEGRAMVRAVRENRRILQVGSMQRSSREFRVACELVRNQVIGKVSKVEVGFSGPAIPCDLPGENPEAGLDWSLWLGPAPSRAYNSALSPRGVHKHYPDWRKYREYGGGGVCDWGAHHLDIAQWALDLDDSGPTDIFPAGQPEAQSGVRLRYASGVEIAHVVDNGVTFYGDKGKLYVNRGKFQLWIGSQLKTEDVGECALVAKELLPANAESLYHSENHLSDWLSSMRTRKRPVCDVEIGQRTATACNLVNLAYYHGQRMKWDPKKEQFADGTGNPKWLGREYREPWKLS